MCPLGLGHFEPQGYNLNKFGRDSLDYATHLITRL